MRPLLALVCTLIAVATAQQAPVVGTWASSLIWTWCGTGSSIFLHQANVTFNDNATFVLGVTGGVTSQTTPFSATYLGVWGSTPGSWSLFTSFFIMNPASCSPTGSEGCLAANQIPGVFSGAFPYTIAKAADGSAEYLIVAGWTPSLTFPMARQ